MVSGYWTILLFIMVSVLLLTGWKQKIDSYVSLKLVFYITLCSIISFWFPMFITIQLMEGTFVIHASFIIFAVLYGLYILQTSENISILYQLMCIVMISLLWATKQALFRDMPWFEAFQHTWDLSLICGIMTASLSLTVSRQLWTIFSGAAFGEFIVVWQQQGLYEGPIGSLNWWDQVNMAAFISISISLVFKKSVSVVKKYIQNPSL